MACANSQFRWIQESASVPCYSFGPALPKENTEPATPQGKAGSSVGRCPIPNVNPYEPCPQQSIAPLELSASNTPSRSVLRRKTFRPKKPFPQETMYS